MIYAQNVEKNSQYGEIIDMEIEHKILVSTKTKQEIEKVMASMVVYNKMPYAKTFVLDVNVDPNFLKEIM